MTTAQLKEYHEELNLPLATRLAIMEAHSIGLEKSMAEALWKIQNGVINPMANPACKMRNLKDACDLLANPQDQPCARTAPRQDL